MSFTFDNLEAVFFDLDGTLLGLSDTDFEGIYTKLISKRFSDLIEPEKFMKALWIGTEAMYEHNDSEKYVLESFFESFTQNTGISREVAKDRFDAFYRNEFGELSEVAKPVPEARQLVDILEDRGIKVVLATNPVFPEIATRRRCKWTNLDYDEFAYVSHAENSYATKPNPEYYLRLSKIVDIDPKSALMVGNDFLFDMSASSVGMKTWMIDRFQGNEEYKGKFKIDHEGPLNNLLDILTE